MTTPWEIPINLFICREREREIGGRGREGGMSRSGKDVWQTEHPEWER